MKSLGDVRIVQPEDTGCGCGSACGCADGSTVGNASSITEAVKERYSRVAARGASSEIIDTSCCSNASALYSESSLESVTPQAAAASEGCGNPVGIAEVRAGEKVLDLGSGGGIDCFLAAQATGADGHVYGVDMTPDMVKLARENAAKLDAQNVTFLLGKIEAVPLPDETVDLVISNCVIALAPDKDLVFDEVFRLLKPGGRFVVSDVVSTTELPEEARQDLDEWVSCIGGADYLPRYLDRFATAGFGRIEVVTDVPMNSEPAEDPWRASLRSVTVRGYRPASS